MAQSAYQDFILHFATSLSCFPVNKKVHTMFTPILIPDKNTHELGNNVNPTSKKLKFSRFWTFLFSNKKNLKRGRKTIHHELVHEG